MRAQTDLVPSSKVQHHAHAIMNFLSVFFFSYRIIKVALQIYAGTLNLVDLLVGIAQGFGVLINFFLVLL